MQSNPLAVARRAKRIQPAHDISNSHIPHLGILSILCQYFVALDQRDQKTCSLFRNQVAADRSLRLPLPQSHSDFRLPRPENSLQSLAELFVKLRHLLRQIDQRTTAPYVSWPMRYRLHNPDQGIDWVLVFAALQRT